MPRRRRIVQSVYDPPIYLGDGERLIGAQIIRGGPEYGHVLFKHSACVEVVGAGVLVKHCVIEQQPWVSWSSAGLRIP